MENPTGLFPIYHARRSDFNPRSHSLKYYLNIVLFLSFILVVWDMRWICEVNSKENHHNRVKIKEQASTDLRQKLEKQDGEREVQI